jgi:hypothetical protein
MANVPYQSYKPAAPDPQTVIKTTGDNTTGHIQHVNIDDVPVTTRQNTGVKALTVAIGPTDPISDIPVMIDYDHHQIHEGEMWHWDVYIANLAANATYDIVFTVPNITIPAGTPTVMLVPHFRYDVTVNDLCNYFFYEGPTVTAATGTARTPINYERNGTYTVKLAILDAPTVTVVGTQIDSEYFLGAATAQSRMAASGGSLHEIPLRNNTSYLFRVVSLANGCDIHIDFIWYEDLGV